MKLRDKLIALGWIDANGRSLTWQYWQAYWSKKR